MTRKLMLACVVLSMGVSLVGRVALAAGFRGTSGPDEIRGAKKQDTRGPLTSSTTVARR